MQAAIGPQRAFHRPDSVVHVLCESHIVPSRQLASPTKPQPQYGLHSSQPVLPGSPAAAPAHHPCAPQCRVRSAAAAAALPTGGGAGSGRRRGCGSGGRHSAGLWPGQRRAEPAGGADRRRVWHRLGAAVWRGGCEGARLLQSGPPAGKLHRRGCAAGDSLSGLASCNTRWHHAIERQSE